MPQIFTDNAYKKVHLPIGDRMYSASILQGELLTNRDRLADPNDDSDLALDTSLSEHKKSQKEQVHARKSIYYLREELFFITNMYVITRNSIYFYLHFILINEQVLLQFWLSATIVLVKRY